MWTLLLAVGLGMLAGALMVWAWQRWSLHERLAAALDRLRREHPSVAPLQRPLLGDDALDALLNQLGESFRYLERELEQAQARQHQLAALFDHLSDGVVLIDPEGRVVGLNRAARNLLAGARDSAVGRPYPEVVRDYELNELVAQALAGSDTQPGRFVELGRPRRSVQALASVLHGAEQPLVTLVLRDITELRRTETIRRDFVANVSHDLRTPLAALQALVDTLLDGALADRAVAEDFLRRIATEVEHLTRLVSQLLELTKAESGQLHLARVLTDLVTLARSTLERFRPRADAKRIRLELVADDRLPPVPCDPDRIVQVLANMLDNALKFTPEDGCVRLELARDENAVHVRVRDTGPGIPSEEIDRVFERFFKGDRARSSSGSGLGLAIAKHLVQLHGGRVWAENAPEGGAVVGFTLPLARD
ncbi:ATP-binding protein [Thermomicrobium sp. 4228-Ro]|uniref:sensor histidine kinase n=1 Tax=Thermomicrobium sp. 4228-Ro TaxID=2993937 RepID=UPI0022492D4D|nr:ATP-binding protein [Thermomicrobium sp. 4228-Ro]MCX2727132.1 ATP-binding protein [Thermomicrobium sp. 4228-Ro]